MRKTVIALVIGLALANISNNANAQSTAIKLNLFSPVVKTISVFVEHAVSDSKSVQLGFFYTGASVSDTKFSGFGITPEFRMYLSETSAPEGFYVAPFARYQSFTLKEEVLDSEASMTTIGGGLLIGKQWLFGEKVVLDGFIGPSYGSSSFDVKSGSENDFSVGGFSGFGVRFGLALGVAF